MSSQFRGDIQGLRALAVLLVVLYHSGVQVLSGGYVGVDVFFVISGFLITSHIWSEIARTGRLGFAAFYARRARRILPASFAVLALSLIAAAIWVPPLQLESTFTDAVATALYLPNVVFAVRGTDYLAETAPSVFQHFWSLGIEEQFYLLWPLFLVVALALTRKSLRGLTIVTALAVAASFALSVMATPVSQPLAFFLLPTRAWELGVGALLALVTVRRPEWLQSKLVGAAGWLGLAGILGASLVLTSESLFPGWLAAIPVLGTALVIASGFGDHGVGPARLLSIRPALFFGAISYSLYLVHWPLLVIPQAAVGLEQPLPLRVTLALGALAVPLAWLSYRFIETPGRSARFFASARPRRTLTAALIASAVVAGVGLAGAQVATPDPPATARSVDATPVGTQVVGTAFVPANLTPDLENAKADNPAIYQNGCHRGKSTTDASGCLVGAEGDAPLVALFGDSHAAQWYPALAELADDGMLRLDTNTKSACPSASIAIADYPSCESWREGVIARLNESQPDIIIISNYGDQYVRDADDPAAMWRAAMAATLDALPSDSRIVMIADTPHTTSTPAICLSSNLTDTAPCDFVRAEAVDLTTRDAEADLGDVWIDFVDYFCDDTICPVIQGNTLVFRDAHHISATFALEMTDVLRERIFAEP